MELRNIETFAMVVENGSFSKAAEILGYTQSTVTVHIKQLEEEFGVLLFERIGKRIHLTEEGELFYDQAVRIIKAVKDADRVMTKDTEPSGVLRLGTVASLSSRRMPQLLLKLHEEYPKIEVRLESEAPGLLLDMLRHNELDILYMTSDQIQGDDLIVAYERNEPLHFVASSSNPIAKRKHLSLEEVIKEEFVISSGNYHALTHALGEAPDLDVFLWTGMPDLIVRAVADSNAVTLLPDYITSAALESGRLVRLPVKGIDEMFELKAVYHKNKWVTPEMEAFISIIKEN